MSTEKNTVDSIRQLIAELKEYAILQKDYAKLQFVEKLTILLLSTLILIFILITLGMVTLFYLLFSLAYVLEPLVGLSLSFCLIACLSISIIICMIVFRKNLITNPLVRFLATLFLKDSNK